MTGSPSDGSAYHAFDDGGSCTAHTQGGTNGVDELISRESEHFSFEVFLAVEVPVDVRPRNACPFRDLGSTDAGTVLLDRTSRSHHYLLSSCRPVRFVRRRSAHHGRVHPPRKIHDHILTRKGLARYRVYP